MEMSSLEVNFSLNRLLNLILMTLQLSPTCEMTGFSPIKMLVQQYLPILIQSQFEFIFGIFYGVKVLILVKMYVNR